MRPALPALLLAVAMLLPACANISTLGRSTSLPGETSTEGKAIHLDAQQRVVMVQSALKYCAEPSPDALAAYAASLGVGASIPGQGSGSLAQALQSSAGSIGLRTQSITLMRDALYRMCEAYMKGSIGPTQVATLLARSQDLTAVILAVEQLTGAVSANQVILTGTAGAGASASLLSNQQLLDAAREDEAAKKKKLAEAEAARDEAAKDVDDQTKLTEAARSAGDPTKLEAEEEKQSKLQAKLDAANIDVDTKEQLLDESTKVRETIESARDSALTNAVANTTSSGQFSTPVQRKELSKEATEQIADAVTEMVKTVLAKDYTTESCMALMTNAPDKLSPLQEESLEEARLLCLDLMKAQVQAKLTASWNPDASTDTIRAAIQRDPDLKGRLQQWLAASGSNVAWALFLNGEEYAALRQRAIREFSIR